MNKKSIGVVIIVLVSAVIFSLYIMFLTQNKYCDFIPYALGSFTVFAIYVVKNIGNKPQELNLKDNNENISQSNSNSLIEENDLE